MSSAVETLGSVFKAFREKDSLTQEALADRCGEAVSRTAVALLEQGRRLPAPDALRQIAEILKVPEALWQPFATKSISQRLEFEEALGELVGRPITLRAANVQAAEAVENAIVELFSGRLTVHQAFDCLNSTLVYYGIPRMERAFFDRYFTAGAFQSRPAFERAVRDYQRDAIRLFSTFGEAYRRLQVPAAELDELLAPLRTRSVVEYGERTVWDAPDGLAGPIAKIAEEKLPYLGYISVANYRKQRTKRDVLARYLRELAAGIRAEGSGAVEKLPEKRRRKIDSLMRELESRLKHTPISPLFTPNPAELEAEAARILRDEQDEGAMEATQSEALRNLANYVSADFMDVYVATSMRTDADFVSVNRFVNELFLHEAVAPLRLRYFNPTQSWIEDRAAKGLVEALMLRRAYCAVYMAQKSDSFGKDSEASVALGQGKPVIVYVPKLTFPDGRLDSESLHQQDDQRLREILLARLPEVERELDDTLDHEALYAEVLTTELRALSDKAFSDLVVRHWADFGLPDESDRIRGKDETKRRDAFTKWVRQVSAGGNAEPTPDVRVDVQQILVALTVRFEQRATLFKAIHPLALQVILSTGVLNGILVVRSVESCARMLRGLIENRLDLDLRVEADNYKLIERSTGSTIRIISKNSLLVNALDNLYGRL